MHLFTTLLRRAVVATVVAFSVMTLHAQSEPSPARQGQPHASQPPAAPSAPRGSSAPSSGTNAPGQGRGNRGNVPAWWRETSPFSKELALTKDQITKIEKHWQETGPELIKLNDDLKRRENMLSEVIKDEAGEAQVKIWIERVEKTRSQYNQTRQLMLYHMHQALTQPQRAKFQEVHARWQQEVDKAAELERRQKQMNQGAKPLNPGGKTDGSKSPAEPQRGRPGQ